jgi:hypothetical protein
MPRAPRVGGGTAFGVGGNRAFRDPQTMTAPDQAFSAAMAKPQGGALPPAPSPVGPVAGPTPLPPTQG